MQDLDKFKNEMNLSGKNVYVGHRYVPKMSGEWTNTKTYEPLSVVTYQGASYTSRQNVPTGVDITNEDFWVLTGNYNAQVENYRQEVINVNKEVKTGLKTVKDEVVAARNNATGETFDSLKERIDSDSSKTSEIFDYSLLSDTYLTNGKKSEKCIVSFIADDAPKNDLTKLLPVMSEKNVPFGVGVITNRVGKTVTASTGEPVDYMTWEDIKYIESQGAEIMAHTHNHEKLTTLTESQIEYDLENNFRELRSRGYIADGFIYPFNARDMTANKIVNQYAKYAFIGENQGSHDNFIDLNNNAIRRVNLGAIGDSPKPEFPQNTLSLEYYKARVDWAFENNAWLVFVLHTAISEWMNEEQQQYLRETIDYIKSKGIEIASPRNGFIKKGNVLQVGDKIIHADGSNNISPINLTGVDAKTADMGIDEFELNKITITPTTLTTANRLGLEHYPKIAAGVLSVYNLATSTKSLKYRKYEITTVYNGTDTVNEVFIQNWDTDKWDKWRLYSSTEPALIFKGRKNITTQSIIDVSDRNNFITIDQSNGEGDIIEQITGGVEGTEVIIFNTLTSDVTIKNHDNYGNNRIMLKNRTDLLLGTKQTLRIVKVGTFWVEV